MRHVRWYLVWGPSIVVGVLALAALIGLAFLIYRGAPITYQAPQTAGASSASLYRGVLAYRPVSETVEPGQTLEYTPTLTIQHGGKIENLRTLWRADDMRARDCAGAVVPTIQAVIAAPRYISGVLRGNVVVYEVPRVPSGDYVLATVAVGATGGEADYVVAFRVVNSPCG